MVKLIVSIKSLLIQLVLILVQDCLHWVQEVSRHLGFGEVQAISELKDGVFICSLVAHIQVCASPSFIFVHILFPDFFSEYTIATVQNEWCNLTSNRVYKEINTIHDAIEVCSL